MDNKFERHRTQVKYRNAYRTEVVEREKKHRYRAGRHQDHERREQAASHAEQTDAQAGGNQEQCTHHVPAVQRIGGHKGHYPVFIGPGNSGGGVHPEHKSNEK